MKLAFSAFFDKNGARVRLASRRSGLQAAIELIAAWRPLLHGCCGANSHVQKAQNFITTPNHKDRNVPTPK
jgi:hypothetical protein